MERRYFLKLSVALAVAGAAGSEEDGSMGRVMTVRGPVAAGVYFPQVEANITNGFESDLAWVCALSSPR